MNLFYTQQYTDTELILSGEESHHCSHVLRKNNGDEIHATDGKGSHFKAIINSIQKKELRAEIIGKSTKEKSFNAELTIAIAIPKSNNRLEYFLQKATEIGVDKIIPIISAHSERKKINIDRSRKVLLSAMKQSFQVYLPDIYPIQAYRALLKNNDSAAGIIAHLDPEAIHIFDAIDRLKDTTILIGPEGGFNDEEISVAVQRGYVKAHMGQNRLRTETAGVFACSAFQIKNR